MPPKIPREVPPQGLTADAGNRNDGSARTSLGTRRRGDWELGRHRLQSIAIRGPAEMIEYLFPNSRALLPLSIQIVNMGLILPRWGLILP